MKELLRYFIVIQLILFTSCSSSNEIEEVIDSNPDSAEENSKPNILLIIADDMGLDVTSGYNIGHQTPIMPTIESMISSGVKFTNVWSNPTCTPTRATLLTGKYGFRTNVLEVDDELSTSETSIQKYINQNLDDEYSNAVIGKWHLSKDSNHPSQMGIDYYAGSLAGSLRDYNKWSLTINGETSISTEYNTTKYTDLAINWIQDQTKPWFLWLAYTTPHEPFHLPPTGLHSLGDLPTDAASIETNPIPYYFAMIEAMDKEIGRLLNSMTSEEKENTVIIFIGDNGTPNQVTEAYNSKRVKGSLYQGGINVPMIVSGRNVMRINETENALINTTDLFATIANVAGVNVDKINDSNSFYKLLSNSTTQTREYAYAEDEFNVTIRNNTHKYMLFSDGSEALYNLENDNFETINLLNKNRLPLSDYDAEIKTLLIEKLAGITH
ncbi:sulfatase-like hydrolase/transferase [Lutibacter sp. A64]|uniref:sulfatase-like hydrolase/transferase n=1 Tax=Lutibacter sp. A64 TaxID=2918526 RepID=UPI001F054DB5|nr:sulfatase-like hydrolase/transferase [Lutibacter sp. A64]UMB52809.1 sulfatase-like hydrolase/transferase [Lutibacter sp. A64]